MIRTIDREKWQLRFDWTGFAVFFGRYKMKAIKVYWWSRPRIVLDLTDNNPLIFPRWKRR